MARRRKRAQRVKYEFKPDIQRLPLLKRLHLTKLQQKLLLKWFLYGLTCLLLLVIQDVIMSRIHIFGAVTDLVPAAILLICVTEDAEDGGLFALAASILYAVSGTAPGPYIIAYLCFLGIGAAVFRQTFWRRGFTSNILCAGIALMLYELCVFATGIFLGLTFWGRCLIFVLTGLYSCAVMLPLYPLLRAIGKIGGEIWKE